MDINKPVKARNITDSLYNSIRNGKRIEEIPRYIKQIFEDDLWKRVEVPQTKSIETFDTFTDYVTTSPPWGLGITVDNLLKLIDITKDMEAYNMVDEATKGKAGKTWDSRTQEKNTVSNRNNNNRPVGTSKQNAIRRLRKSRPDLLQSVVNNEMSANAAMIEAGFRKKTVTIPVSIEGIVKKLKKLFDADEIARIIELLSDE